MRTTNSGAASTLSVVSPFADTSCDRLSEIRDAVRDAHGLHALVSGYREDAISLRTECGGPHVEGSRVEWHTDVLAVTNLMAVCSQLRHRAHQLRIKLRHASHALIEERSLSGGTMSAAFAAAELHEATALVGTVAAAIDDIDGILLGLLAGGSVKADRISRRVLGVESSLPNRVVAVDDGGVVVVDRRDGRAGDVSSPPRGPHVRTDAAVRGARGLHFSSASDSRGRSASGSQSSIGGSAAAATGDSNGGRQRHDAVVEELARLLALASTGDLAGSPSAANGSSFAGPTGSSVAAPEQADAVSDCQPSSRRDAPTSKLARRGDEANLDGTATVGPRPQEQAANDDDEDDEVLFYRPPPPPAAMGTTPRRPSQLAAAAPASPSAWSAWSSDDATSGGVGTARVPRPQLTYTDL